tara:strand:+ start:529 stop:663 length:135 start_codon:yes stop_codon:yes gene_type:complete
VNSKQGLGRIKDKERGREERDEERRWLRSWNLAEVEAGQLDLKL